jgi:hypothetical protein
MRPGRRSAFSPRKLLLWSALLAWLGCGGGTDVVLPSLSVTTSTTGVEPDPDGYSVVVDEGQGQPIGPAATLIVERLSEGAHSVALTGLAANCAAADNPRGVTVQSGATANVAFTVTCSATSGTIEVTTTTSGPGSDPDGFALLLDGADRGLIGVSATASLTGLTPGPHTVGLTGLAANCQVTGDNPRSVTVAAGQTVPAPFAVTCNQPPASSGSVRITTATSGTPTDPDGYSVSADGGQGQLIGTNASLTLAGLAVGAHSIQLAGMAANCHVSGASTRNVSVAQGQTATVAFTITCSATTGGLTVTVNGLPAGTAAAITVAGPAGFSQAVTGSTTLTGLAPGNYTVTSAQVTINGAAYTGTIDRPNVTIAAGATAAVSVSYALTSGSTLNLRINGLYLTQSVQTPAGGIPLVKDRQAYLRVFVVASGSNSATPAVRVRFYRAGVVIRTLTINAPRGSTPTAVQEGELGSSWNQLIDASLIQPDVSILADVDPSNTVAESNENDNRFPTSGDPQALKVQAVPTALIRFVPIRQAGQTQAGNVTAANKDGMLELARRLYPLKTVDSDVHAVFTVDTTLVDDGRGWNRVLFDLEDLRVAEGSDRTYYGVAKLDYFNGQVGVGLVGRTSSGSPRAALGWDDPSDVQRVVAHELGHTWGQFHAPCGDPPTASIDPNFPYQGGDIGVYGYDVSRGDLEPPFLPDIMGYCATPWISDYMYQRVLAFRQAQPAAADAALVPQECVMVSGYIENGRPVLEPTFQIVTRPVLPGQSGPYRVSGIASDGTALFDLSFEAAQVADDPSGGRHFAFAVPLDRARAARLGSMKLSGPGIPMAAIAPSFSLVKRTPVPSDIIARRSGDRVQLEWNAATHPKIMVRDPDTGEILSFARGGSARVLTAKGELELNVSDGVQSYRLRKAISRR